MLRIFDPANPAGDRVGFDLGHIFATQGAPESFIPRELDLKVGGVGELAVGELAKQTDSKQQRTGSKQQEPQPEGKVLVSMPGDKPMLADTMVAPAWLTEYLGIDPKAGKAPKVNLGLWESGDDLTAFAWVDGSTRGAKVSLHIAALVARIPALKLDAKAPAPSVQKPGAQSPTKSKPGAAKMLIVTFGSDAGMHGEAGWRLDRLFADPTLATLANPDHLEIDAKDGLSVRRDADLDVTGLVNRGAVSLDGMPWAAGLLDDSKATAAAAYTSASLDQKLRIALVAQEAKPTKKHPGIELDVPKDLVDTLQRRALRFEQELGARAGGLSGGGGFAPTLTPQGIRLERAKTGQTDTSFALFSWAQLARVAGGALDANNLIPDQLHIATKSMSFTVDALAGGAPKTMPADTVRVRDLDAMLAEPLEHVGLDPMDAIAIDKHASKVRDPKTRRVTLVAAVYHPSATDQTKIEHATRLELDVDVEAVLHHFLPTRGLGKHAAEPTEAHRTTFGAQANVGGAGIDLSVEIKHRTKDGEVVSFALEAGWTVDQLIALITAPKVDDDARAKDGAPAAKAGPSAASFAPQNLQGQFANDDFRIKLAANSTPYKSTYNCHLADVPFVGALVGTLLPARVLNAAVLHLKIASLGELKTKVLQLKDGFLPVVGCAIEIPGDDNAPSRFYGVDLDLSIKALAPLIALVPGLDEVYAIAKQMLTLIKDPAEALDQLLYAPELIYDMAKLGPAAWQSMKENGWKNAALTALESGDTETRQLVMAMRIVRKIGLKHHKKGEPIPPIADVPADYLKWLSDQETDALGEQQELAAELKAAGIDPPDDYTVPKQPLDINAVRTRRDDLANGFTKFADAKAKADASDDPKAKAAAAAAAAELRTLTAKLIAAGARGSGSTDTSASAPAPASGMVAPAAIAGGELFDVSHLPVASPDQIAEATDVLHGPGMPDKAMSAVHIQYLAQKFAWLSTDQLAELLATNSTAAKTDQGIVSIPMFADERPFVRGLFDHRRGVPTGQGKPTDKPPTDNAQTGNHSTGRPATKNPASQNPATADSQAASDDAKQVAAYRAQSKELRAARAEAAAGMGLKPDGTPMPAGDGSGQGGAGASQTGTGLANGQGGDGTGQRGDGSGLTETGPDAGTGAGTGATAAQDGTGPSQGTGQKPGHPDASHHAPDTKGVDAANTSKHGGALPTNEKSSPSAPSANGPDMQGHQANEQQEVERLTHMNARLAQTFVAFDLKAGNLTLNKSTAKQFIGGQSPVSETGTYYKIKDVYLESTRPIGRDGSEIVQYTLAFEVVQVVHGKDSRNTYKTLQSFTYVPSTADSHSQSAEVNALGKQMSAALQVHGDAVNILSNGPFSSGPYTVSISQPGFIQNVPGNDSLAKVQVRMKLDKGGDLSVLDYEFSKRRVLADGETALIQLAVRRTP